MADHTTGHTASRRIEAALANVQPLRDLARNWDVDIASFLEDYLNDIVGHLEDERNDLEEPEGPPNFAQAALLLQNSSSVYSRKVEYLYSLVYAALDDLASSTTGLVPKHQRKTADASIDEFNAFDPDMQFLLLDDVLPIDETEAGDKINLDDDEDDEYSADRNRLSITRLSTTRLSLGGMSVTRADQSSFGNKNVNAARSIMGSLFQQGDDAGAGSLKLVNGSCDVSDKGTLVMPGTALPESQKSRLDVNSSPAPADNDDDGGMMYDDDHDDGVGFELADDHEPTVHFETADNDPPVVQPAQKVETNKNDPWVLLDPHDIGPTKARPLRIGVTYRLPEGLDEPPSKAATGAHTRRRTFPTRKHVDRAAPIVVSIATETFRATVANRRQQRVAAMTSLEEKDSMDQDESVNDSCMFHIAVARPRVSIKGLAFGDEFAYIAKAAAKRKASERRERRKLLVQDPQAVVEESEHLFGYDDYDAGDNDSIGGNYDDDGVGNTGIVSLADAHATLDARDASNLEAIEFEALCRAHIKSFAKGAEKYAAETDLTKRVGEWQSKLAPILEEEERRPEFNIHDYGDRVIDIMSREVEKKIDSSKNKNVVSFQQVTKNCEHFDVCRLFLASLNLTSAGNVALASRSGPDSLNFKLLNTRVDHPMENYIAPSATVL